MSLDTRVAAVSMHVCLTTSEPLALSHRTAARPPASTVVISTVRSSRCLEERNEKARSEEGTFAALKMSHAYFAHEH